MGSFGDAIRNGISDFIDNAFEAQRAVANMSDQELVEVVRNSTNKYLRAAAQVEWNERHGKG